MVVPWMSLSLVVRSVNEQPQGETRCQYECMIEKPVRIEVFRSMDEPRLQLGETIPVKEGFVGVVLASFTPQSDPSKVGYIVGPRRLSP